MCQRFNWLPSVVPLVSFELPLFPPSFPNEFLLYCSRFFWPRNPNAFSIFSSISFCACESECECRRQLFSFKQAKDLRRFSVSASHFEWKYHSVSKKQNCFNGRCKKNFGERLTQPLLKWKIKYNHTKKDRHKNVQFHGIWLKWCKILNCRQEMKLNFKSHLHRWNLEHQLQSSVMNIQSSLAWARCSKRQMYRVVLNK